MSIKVQIDSIPDADRWKLAEKNADLEFNMLNNTSIPYYVVITPDGKVIDSKPGL